MKTKKTRKKAGGKKKDNFFYENYSKSWNFLKENKKFIYVILAVFFAFTLIGFFIPAPPALIEEILKLIKEIIEQTEGMGFVELFNFIFWNNLKVSFIGMITGVFLGIFPLFTCIGNGYLLGFVAVSAVKIDGILSLWRIFPHGIFELPAVFISLALGLRLGMHFLQTGRTRSFKGVLKESMRVFIFIVIPLLLIAAIIESWLVVVLS